MACQGLALHDQHKHIEYRKTTKWRRTQTLETNYSLNFWSLEELVKPITCVLDHWYCHLMPDPWFGYQLYIGKNMHYFSSIRAQSHKITLFVHVCAHLITETRDRKRICNKKWEIRTSILIGIETLFSECLLAQ